MTPVHVFPALNTCGNFFYPRGYHSTFPAPTSSLVMFPEAAASRLPNDFSFAHVFRQSPIIQGCFANENMFVA